MYFVKFFGVIISLALLAYRAAASSPGAPSRGVQTRSLTAAQPHRAIKSRGLSGSIAHHLELNYIDESTHQTTSQFAARVRMQTKLPTLVLEEIEHHTEAIVCGHSSIYLYFASPEALYELFEEFSAVGEFFVISSHEGCNNDGVRVAYMVSDMYIDEKDKTIVLSSNHSSWEDTAHSMEVSFGPSDEVYVLRQHHDLKPRQAATSSAAVSSALASFVQSVSSSTSVDFPSPTSMAGLPSETNIRINTSWLNKQIWPMEWDTSVGNISLDGPAIPSGFTLGCKDCSIHGGIDLMAGSFNATATNSTTDDLEKLKYFFEYGYVELRSNSFGAHIELETTIQPSASLVKYHVNLPSINFLGFEIPAIATVGPLLTPQLRMGLQLQTELDFTYGFDVKVPDDSIIRIDLINITNSFVSGFTDATITALPFQAQLSGLDLVLSTSFSPELLLGIGLFEIDTNIGAGVRFDLPSVTATVKEVSGVDSNCNESSSGSQIFGNLTHIVPAVDVGLDLIAFVDITDLGLNIDDAYQALETSIPLQTACLSFDSNAKTYGHATATSTASGSATTASSSATTSSGAVATFNPVRGLVDNLGLWYAATALFVATSFMFTRM